LPAAGVEEEEEEAPVICEARLGLGEDEEEEGMEAGGADEEEEEEEEALLSPAPMSITLSPHLAVDDEGSW